MRFFTVSDIHADYRENLKWIEDLSEFDFKNDTLIFSGDISDKIDLTAYIFGRLKRSFRNVFFVPGNHDLWVRNDPSTNSIEKFHILKDVAEDCGVLTDEVSFGDVRIVPLLGWYDYSFGEPENKLHAMWNDFNFCSWPDDFDYFQITEMFINLNSVKQKEDEFLISFSHFLPFIEVMPSFIPQSKRFLYPVLGSARLGEQVLKLESDVHIYGHSHVNNVTELFGTLFINNAYGYPSEQRICRKKLYEIKVKKG